MNTHRALPPIRSAKRGIYTLLLACLLPACKPTYPAASEALPITPTLSADGKLLVVLDHSGQETPRLRIKWLDRQEPWLELPAPKYTNSIRFGFTGYDLLLTHARPGPQGASQLSRWDPSQPSKPSEILYEGNRVTFPVEFKPGQVLIRMCPEPAGVDACKNSTGIYWALVTNGQAVVIPGSRSQLYDQPNVVDGGFFWLEDEYESKKRGNPAHREIAAFALPGGRVPEFDISRFDETSRNLMCDSQAQRCLLKYLTDERVNGSLYVYGFKIFDGPKTCLLPSIKGWQDKYAVTPDGRTAVISVSRVHTEPRHVVVLRFEPGQCEPVSIEHLQFKESTP